MKKEDLTILEKQIASLSEDERCERDIYLKRLADGTYQGPETGYASIDRPWVKNFTDEDLHRKLEKMTAYSELKERAKAYSPKKVALGYLGQNVTYEKVFKMIDAYAASFRAMGVKPGDVISICLVNQPEVVAAFYAANKIGAVANMLDPRTNPSTLIRAVNDAKSDVVVTLDLLQCVFDKTNATKVVPISSIEYLPGIVQKVVKAKDKSLVAKKSNSEKIVNYKEFIKCGKGMPDFTAPYVENAPVCIAYTGGTTGAPKGAIVTDKAFNSMVQGAEACHYDVDLDTVSLNIAPPWTYYGLNNGIHPYLCLGIKQILVPKFAPEEYSQLVYKNKINYVMGVPANIIALFNDKKLEGKDLSFIKNLIVGADKLDPTLEEKGNEFLKAHNCNTRILKGWGMTEAGAVVSCTRLNQDIIGTVGVPYIFYNVGIFDEQGNEVNMCEKGEICVLSPKNMTGYFGENAHKSSEVLKEHADGTVWVHSGDIGHFDKEGNLIIDGRIKRMFTRNGFKIFPAELENCISRNEKVELAAVVAKSDDELGNKIIAYVQLQEGTEFTEELKNQIYETLRANIYDYEIPDDIKSIEKMPLTGMNKVNFKALEALELEETKKLTLK